jgi:hypothetical protein
MVHVDGTGKQQYESPTTNGQNNFQLHDLDPNTVFSYIVNASRSATLPWIRPSGEITEANFPFLTMAAIPFTNSNPGSSYLKPFLDVQVFTKSVSDAFSGIFTLLVSEQMLRPQDDTIQGNLQYAESRLHVEKLPTVIIAALMLLCLVFAVTLVFISPTNVVPHNPNSIGGIATIIGPIANVGFLGHSHFNAITQALKSHKISSTTPNPSHPIVHGAQFDIVVHPSLQDKEFDISEGEPVHPRDAFSWCPLTLHTLVRISAMALCLVSIIALEILQRKSNRSNGIMDVSSSNKAHIWSSWIPTLAMTGIALLYSSMHFNIALLAPYYNLKNEKGARTTCSITTDYLGSTPFFTLWSSIKLRHYATTISALSAVVGAFLTIAVSGLYSLEPFNVNTSFDLERSDEWNVTWSIYDDDSSAGQVLQYTTWKNLSQPQWTYEDLAFPSVSIAPYAANVTSQQKVVITLPARRAVLDCVATGPDDNVISIDSDAYGGSTYVYTSVRNTCLDKLGKVSPLLILTSRAITSYGGTISQLLFNRLGSASAIDPNPDRPTSNPEELGPTCPSLSFSYGSFPDSLIPFDKNSTSPRRNLSSSDAQVTTLACSQMIQELDTKVTFLLPDFAIDTLHPPLPDESSMRYIGGVYQFPIVAPLQSTFAVLSSNTTFKQDMDNLGSFFAAIIYGKDGIPAVELVGEANIPCLISAVSKMYGRYMAQVMSRKMRASNESSASKQFLQSSLMGQKSRLVQNTEAKLVLQVLLGVMMVCGILSWVLMRKVRILPHNPCSIAGTACLLAGREFWGEDAREIKKIWAEDQVFRLEPRGERLGIYAGNAESGRLVT